MADKALARSMADSLPNDPGLFRRHLDQLPDDVKKVVPDSGEARRIVADIAPAVTAGYIVGGELRTLGLPQLMRGHRDIGLSPIEKMAWAMGVIKELFPQRLRSAGLTQAWKDFDRLASIYLHLKYNIPLEKGTSSRHLDRAMASGSGRCLMLVELMIDFAVTTSKDPNVIEQIIIDTQRDLYFFANSWAGQGIEAMHAANAVFRRRAKESGENSKSPALPKDMFELSHDGERWIFGLKGRLFD